MSTILSSKGQQNGVSWHTSKVPQGQERSESKGRTLDVPPDAAKDEDGTVHLSPQALSILAATAATAGLVGGTTRGLARAGADLVHVLTQAIDEAGVGVQGSISLAGAAAQEAATGAVHAVEGARRFVRDAGAVAEESVRSAGDVAQDAVNSAAAYGGTSALAFRPYGRDLA